MESSVAAGIDLRSLPEDPYRFARGAKERGQKIIGVTPMHFPEELIDASGAYPVVFQENLEPITAAWSHMFPNFCAFSRSVADAIIKGEIDDFDAVILSDICVQTRWAFQIAKRHMKPDFIYMWWSQEYALDRNVPGAITRLEKVKEEIESVVGDTYGEAEIRASIELYNRQRALLRELFELRRCRRGTIGAREIEGLVQSGMVMSKADHIPVLEAFLGEARERQIPADAESRPAVYVSGHLCHAVRGEILDLIEDAGGLVVDDDMYVGSRYAATDVRTDLPVMEALARRYFDAPCPSKAGAPPEGDWSRTLLANVERSRAGGVLMLVAKHCEPQMFYYPDVRDHLSAAGIPVTLIETEHEVISIEGTKTRIQAFVESIGDAR